MAQLHKATGQVRVVGIGDEVHGRFYIAILPVQRIEVDVECDLSERVYYSQSSIVVDKVGKAKVFRSLSK